MTAARVGVLLLSAALTACASAPKTAAPPASREDKVVSHAPATGDRHHAATMPKRSPYPPAQEDPSKRGDYVAGGLYAPHISDSAPEGEIDVDAIPEPEVRDEPRARTGNRTYSVLGKQYRVRDSAHGYFEEGTASYYGKKFHGRRTSSQEVYDMCQFSAAHKTLPIPSYVRVTRLDTGQSVVVRVNDRGPFHDGRIIDLSFAAASKLGITKTGTAKVEVEALSAGSSSPPPVVPEPVPDSDKRYLQVAAFADEDKAEALRQRLQAAGIEAVFIRKQRVDGDPRWRVRIGPLGELEMRALQQKLREMGLQGLRVGAE